MEAELQELESELQKMTGKFNTAHIHIIILILAAPDEPSGLKVSVEPRGNFVSVNLLNRSSKPLSDVQVAVDGQFAESAVPSVQILKRGEPISVQVELDGSFYGWRLNGTVVISYQTQQGIASMTQQPFIVPLESLAQSIDSVPQQQSLRTSFSVQASPLVPLSSLYPSKCPLCRVYILIHRTYRL